ncbi:MFS family permease [Lipingzhangella halophila]|uniref:MFS family permease n=1 Tax=Lipingzhangella halophila TaxID=1783352 RepID=A0A7W7W301_9ACTN|nr:MFS transporter [Lipingzhangella halophila]MBB4931230.1 MFS family permease [Lipingzhangella halophila]
MAFTRNQDDQEKPSSSTSHRGVHPVAVVVGFTVLCASWMLNAMDRQLFYPLLPDIGDDLGFTLAQDGFLATGFTLGLGVAGFLAGFVVDRYSRKTVIIVSVLVYSLGTAAIPLSYHVADMAVYRIISGVGEGVQGTALYAIVGSFFFHRRAFAAGFIGVAFGGGLFLGPMVGVPFAENFDTWKAPFFLFGSLGLVMAVLIMTLVSRRMSEVKRDIEESAATRDFGHVPASPYNRNIVLFGFGAASSGMIFYGFTGLYPTYLREQLAFESGQAALAVSLLGIGAMLALVAGWLGDKINQKWLLVCTFLIISVIAYLIYNVVTATIGQYVLAFLMGAFASGSLFTNTATAMQRSVRPELVGRGQGLFMLTYYVAAAFSGSTFAWLVSHGDWGQAGLWQLTILPLVAAAVLSFVDRKRMIIPGVK